MLANKVVELSVDEKIELSQLEASIETGFKGFYEAGKALAQIQQKRLYRANYSTFDDYCRDRWQMDRRRAYELIQVAEVYENLSGLPDILPEMKKTHAVALASAEPEAQVEIVQQAKESAPNGKVTTAHIERAVQDHKSGWAQSTPAVSKNPVVEAAVETAQKRANFTPNSTARVTEGKHKGEMVTISRVEGGAIAHSTLPSGGSYPFLVGELELVEAAPAPEKPIKTAPKDEIQQLKELLKEVYCEVGGHLSVGLRDRVEAALAISS